MAFQSPSDGATISFNQQSFGTPGQTKVSGDCQRETTHEICCLAAEWFGPVGKFRVHKSIVNMFTNYL